MIIKSLEFHNYKCFTDYKVDFSILTFIKGANGIGKSTLGKDAHLFCTHGYSDKKLSDLPNKPIKAKSCWVKEEIEVNGNLYAIKRSVPTKLEIWKNNELLEFDTNAEAELYLKSLFGDVNIFKKFRMIDNKVGINFLEEGQVALKKTIFSLSQDKFNQVRDNLNKLKYDRELHNKDNLRIAIHYPSEKRLKIIRDGLVKLNSTYNTLTQEVRTLNSDLNTYNRKQGEITTNKNKTKWQRDKLLQEPICYECKQSLPQPNKAQMLKDKNEAITNLNEQYKNNVDVIEELKEMIIQAEKPIAALNPKKDKLHQLEMVLETRIKHNDFKYNTKDVEIVKRSIKELDSLSSRCLVRSINTLEPIINSVLEKINFQVIFEVNDKGKFAITLRKDEIDYAYNLLSDGQKLILQIAFKLALNLSKNNEGLIVADEGLSSLDSENLLHILTIFENYPFQLIFMLHRADDIPEGIKIIDLNEQITQK